MPHEVEAELAGGVLSKELTAEHQGRAIELGLYATNMPASVGGPGYTALQQVLVQEQCGRVTNGLGWVMATPPQWWVEVATDYQRERWLLPSVRGEKHEAYAITEEFHVLTTALANVYELLSGRPAPFPTDFAPTSSPPTIASIARGMRAMFAPLPEPSQK